MQLSGLGFIALAVWMAADSQLQLLAQGYLDTYINSDNRYTDEVVGLALTGVFLSLVGCLGMVAPRRRNMTILKLVRLLIIETPNGTLQMSSCFLSHRVIMLDIGLDQLRTMDPPSSVHTTQIKHKITMYKSK